MARTKKTQDARVVKGSHLTITYDENNYPVKLEWDDAQLLKDVQDAIATVQVAPETTKKTRKKSK